MGAEKAMAENNRQVAPRTEGMTSNVIDAFETARESASLQAEASSAHNRINIPLNLENWKGLAQEIQEDLLWFHQHLLDRRMNQQASCEAIGYDWSTIYRVLKGMYEGSYKNVCSAIRGYKRLCEERGTIQKNIFVKTSIAELIFGALDYALANNSMAMIIGESRMGKTEALNAWRRENNHGCSVSIEVSPLGGTKMFLRAIADAVGVNKQYSIPVMYDAIRRAFNPNRILIVDEAHRMMPSDTRSTPVNMEILRDLYHDGKGCAVALFATQRFDDSLKKSMYQYEQVLGRIGMPVRLPRTIKKADVLMIVEQYVRRPSDKLMTHCVQIANEIGRLGILVETLKLASRMASKAKSHITEEFVFKSMAMRKQMMGEAQFAAK
jgi:DNA transposition AAA+ family ATPase